MSRSEKNAWWMPRWIERNPDDHWTGEIGGKYRHARRWIQRQDNKAERRKGREAILFDINAEDPETERCPYDSGCDCRTYVDDGLPLEHSN